MAHWRYYEQSQPKKSNKVLSFAEKFDYPTLVLLFGKSESVNLQAFKYNCNNLGLRNHIVGIRKYEYGTDEVVTDSTGAIQTKI